MAGVFSAETMLRGMGVPLTWTLTEPLASAATNTSNGSSLEGLEEGGLDARFKVHY